MWIWSSEGIWPKDAKVYGLQSWYFGYILVIVVVLLVFFFVYVKKGRTHTLLWLPLVTIIVVCTSIKLFSFESAAISNYMTSSADLRFKAMSKYNSYGEQLNVLHHWLYRAGFQRWNRSAPAYIIVTEVLSVTAYFFCKHMNGISKKNVIGSYTAILALMLVLCVLDRNFAISAKFLQSSTEGYPEWAVGEWEGQSIYAWDYYRTLQVLGVPLIDELQLEPQIVYTEPDIKSQTLGCSSKNCYIQSIVSTSKRGWGFTNQCVGFSKDENGFETKGILGFVPLEKAILTAGSFEENGMLIIMARPLVMFADMCYFSLGYGVTENFMHVFEPFEIYLLAPLTAIFGITWLVLLIRCRMTKRKASTT